MFTILFIVLGIYNLFNIQNYISRIIIYIMLFGLGMITLCMFIGKKFGMSYIKYLTGDFKKDKWFEITKAIIILIMIFRQFVYSGYDELNYRFKDCLTPDEITTEWNSSGSQFMVYNSAIIPKCGKQFITLIIGLQDTFKEYKENDEGLKIWAKEHEAQLKAEADEAENGLHELYWYLLSILIVIIIQRCREPFINLIKVLKKLINMRRIK